MKKTLIISLAFLCILTLCANAHNETNSDSIHNDLVSEYFLRNPSTWIQINISKLKSASEIEKPELDTATIYKKLEEILYSNNLIRQNLKQDKFTFRVRQFNDLKNEIQADLEDLNRIQEDIFRFSNTYIVETTNALNVKKEISFFLKNADSTIIRIYQSEIELLDSTLNHSISIASARLANIVSVEDRINNISLNLEETNRQVSVMKEALINSSEHINLPPIWKTNLSDYPLPFSKAVEISYQKAKESIVYFFHHSITKVLFLRLLLTLLLLIPALLYIKNKMAIINAVQTNKYMQKYPIFASIIIVTAMVPVIFAHAPFAFLDVVFIVLTLLVSYIFIYENPHISKLNFLIILVVFIIMKITNFLVSPTLQGRIFFTASILILIPVYKIFRQILDNRKEKRIRIITIFSILFMQMFIGWIMIVFGYYLQGRHFFLSSIDAFILALVLFVTVSSIVDYLKIVAQMTNKYNNVIHIDIVVLDKTVRYIATILATIFFITAYLKNINLFDDLFYAIETWANTSRLLGESTFTYANIFLFFIYSAGSIYIANFVNKVFVSDNSKLSTYKRSAIGSGKLLFRFMIISSGILVGILASGFPLTQFTILIGAFGVGIGFGLQTIFNNLVSGLIIALEKPLAVGDIIEVDGRRGKIKEIGIRSSNIRTSDGSEVLIPNGDLIANKVINWTLSDKHRRMEISIGVAYNSNPRFVIELLNQVLSSHSEVLEDPAPCVFFVGLGDSSLDFTIHLWVSDISESRRISSEVLLGIFEILKANNIEIPFPQRDIHVRTIDSSFVVENKTAKKA